MSLTLLAALAPPATASELRIDTRGVSRAAGATTLQVEASVRWKNAWRHSRNHDAVWLIVKLRGNHLEPWRHGKLRTTSASGAAPAADCTISADRIGAFCTPAATWRGDVNWSLSMEVEAGDGEITEFGLATNADWPSGDHNSGGYGYRGGGYYLRGSAEGPLNPHSRVAQRPYGSWGGGPRGVAYGFRAARTAPKKSDERM